MDKFTASNGIEITVDEDGDYTFTGGERAADRWVVRPGGANETALREFFRAERDAELGRWRWPENPEYVVYPVGGDFVDVLRESSVSDVTLGPGREQGISRTAAAEWDREASRKFYAAARAYFAAHPVRKPWEDAKPGEVWALTTPALGERAYEVARDGARIRFFLITEEEFRSGLFSFEEQITGGRLVWKPEVA